MKPFLLLLLLMPAFTYAQMPVNTAGKIEYSEVITAPGNAQDLYSNGKVFLAHAFKSAKDATQVADNESKTILAKGLVNVHAGGLAAFSGNVSFQFTIQTKDGRYKYTVDNFQLLYDPYGSYNLEDEKLKLGKNNWKQIKEQTHAAITAMIEQMKKEMVETKTTW